MFEQMFFLFQGADAEPEVEYERFYDFDTTRWSSGSCNCSYPFVLSIVGLYIFIERWFSIKRAGKMDENFINNIRASVAAGNIEGAKSLCSTTDTPVARMVEKGFNELESH